jgi:hypothetical protein
MIRSDAYVESLSRIGDVGFAGYPGSIASLKPFPTIKSVEEGKLEGSPI